MTTIDFSAHGFDFAVRSPIPGIEDAFADLLQDMAATDARARTRHVFEVRSCPAVADAVTVSLDDVVLYPTLELDALAGHLLVEVNERAAGSVPGTFALHAGAVADSEGALLLAGVSGAGKSTLTAALTIAGWQFVADEVCVVDPRDLSVLSYPKPVALRHPASASLGVPRLARSPWPVEGPDRLVPASELGAQAPGTLPIRAVLFPERDCASPPQVVPLAPALALERLVHSVLAPVHVSAATFSALADLVQRTPVGVLHYCHIDDATITLSGRVVAARGDTFSRCRSRRIAGSC